MLRYILKRFFLSLITLWLLTTIVFLMVKLLPSDPARTLSGNTAPEASVEAMRVRLGLNDSFLGQYWRVMKGLVTFDFGHSWKNAKRSVGRPRRTRPVPLVQARRPGAAHHDTTRHRRRPHRRPQVRDTRLDRGIVLVGLATSSIPEFVTGALLAVVFGVKLRLAQADRQRFRTAPRC